MKSLVDEIENAVIEEGCAGLWWIGQAGFAFKADRGSVVYLDPYISNYCEEAAGLKRMCIPPVEADDLLADWIVCSHEHPDHLDCDAIRVIGKTNSACMFAVSAGCKEELDKSGIDPARQLIMKPGNKYDLSGLTVYAERADHGEMAPSALSFIFDFGKVRVMFSGDTSYNLGYLQPLIDMKPTVLLPVINGAYGNLNAREAAKLTAVTKPRLAIPCHFWMFIEHHATPGGDPHTFCTECESLCPEVKVKVLSPGEGIKISPDSVQPIQS